LTLDPSAFIKLHTRLAPVPLCPEIKLYLADDAIELWQKTGAELQNANTSLPFWGFAWAGGQALARYLLDHRSAVAGQRVLDLGSGSGLVAIAAAMAGAAHVDANDVDPLALATISMNAAANGAAIHPLAEDVIGNESYDRSWDIILAGDVFYEPGMTERIAPWLQHLAKQGTQVLIGDLGRTYLPQEQLQSLASYDVPVAKGLEDSEIKKASVWRFVEAPRSVTRRDGDLLQKRKYL
jgi:predicted nicotinamide N-methyase